MNAADLINYLDDYLRVREIPDYKGAHNGLQVTGSSEIRRVAFAVDACQATIDRAAGACVDMMIVHHGLFWGHTAPITKRYYQRLAALIKNDIGLYSCHLPLDAHPEVGNNCVLLRKLGLVVDGTFGEYEGFPIGVTANCDLSREEFVARVRTVLGVEPLVMPTGPATVRRIGVLTGGGGSLIDSAVTAGLELFLTGEGAHHTFFDAEEGGINVIYAGHYATETIGVQALGEHIQNQFGLEIEFYDHPTGL